MNNLLVKGKYCTLEMPGRVHIPAKDGGHLIIKPGRHVIDSTELPFNEANELHIMKLIAKRTLFEAFDNDTVLGGIGTYNYQENGNWSVHKPESEQHAHIHVYGRGRQAVTQPYGKALDFSRFEKEPGFSGYPYSSRDIQALQCAAWDVLSEPEIPVYFREGNRPSISNATAFSFTP